MTIYSEPVVEVEGWCIDRLIRENEDRLNKEEDEWYVLRYTISERNGDKRSEQVSIAFDSVTASGSPLQLSRDGHRTGTFSGVLDGANKHRADSDVPPEIIDKLQELGPW